MFPEYLFYFCPDLRQAKGKTAEGKGKRPPKDNDSARPRKKAAGEQSVGSTGQEAGPSTTQPTAQGARPDDSACKIFSQDELEGKPCKELQDLLRARSLSVVGRKQVRSGYGVF